VTRGISRARWIALLTLSAAAARPHSAQTAPAAKIRLGAVPGDTFSEPFFGVESGAFDRAGLSVEVATFPNGGVMLQACAGGAVDVGLADVIQITNAVNAGIPFAPFAAASLYSSDAPTTLLVVAKDGPIRTAKDFEGQTIALNSLHSLPEIATREWLRRNGADPALTKFVEVSGSAMADSVVRGVTAGAVPGEPHLSVEKDRLRTFGKPYDVVAKTFPLILFYARRDWLAANAEEAHRLTDAIYATARWANGHHDETALIVERTAKLDASVVRGMTRARYATSLEPQMLQPVITIATQYKAVKQPIAAADLIARIP
jgi:NitT/TauT family transport system substrate-binding protein